MKIAEYELQRALNENVATWGQCVAEMNGGIFESYSDVPNEYKARLQFERDGSAGRDFAKMLQEGRSWVIDPLEALQPYSFAAFQEFVGPLLVGIMLIKDLRNPDGPDLIRPIAFFDASGRMLEVTPSFSGRTFEQGCDTARDALQSFPQELARSWLWRTEGWRMPGEPFQGPLVHRRLIGHPMSGWKPLDQILLSFDKKKWKWLMTQVLQQLPRAVITLHNPHDGKPYEWTSMRCFLDTRPPGIDGPVGDQFFVIDEDKTGIVYHIHRGQVDKINVLREPAEAIDRYCAHVIGGAATEFDFSPWSGPARG